jgi:hypothetical protein
MVKYIRFHIFEIFCAQNVRFSIIRTSYGQTHQILHGWNMLPLKTFVSVCLKFKCLGQLWLNCSQKLTSRRRKLEEDYWNFLYQAGSDYVAPGKNVRFSIAVLFVPFILEVKTNVFVNNVPSACLFYVNSNRLMVLPNSKAFGVSKWQNPFCCSVLKSWHDFRQGFWSFWETPKYN